MTDKYLEPCKNCLLKMCCSQVCQFFIEYVKEEFQLEYYPKRFPVHMKLAGMHISFIKNGLVNDMSHRMSEYERNK